MICTKLCVIIHLCELSDTTSPINIIQLIKKKTNDLIGFPFIILVLCEHDFLCKSYLYYANTILTYR